jgi:hypothetical protein
MQTYYLNKPRLARLVTRSFRACLVAGALCVSTLITSACAHRVDLTHELHSRVSPFTETRDQVVQLVATSKRSLDAPSINQLAVSYASLEEKGNGYAGFLAEAVSTSSFDYAKNSDYSTNFSKAIDTFNNDFVTINPQQAKTAKISNEWIPQFAASVQSYWDKYHSNLASASPQTKATMAQQLKADTVWPNFEDIATEAVSPSPHQ